jgi:hypothetical protein
MRARDEKRQGHRVPTHFETISTEGEPLDPSMTAKQGIAMLADISYTGAQLHRTDLSPPLGAQIKLQIFLPSQSGVYFELEGQVVRLTTDGFAIQYDRPSPEICRLVDDAASLV